MKQTDTLKRLNAVMKDINGDNTQILRALQDQIDMMDVPGNTYSFHLHDANKNVMQVTDGNGLANGVNAYSPYGANIGNVTNPFGFSSEYFSHTINAISYNYRSLFANLGRWGNKDPLGEIYSKNLYSFSINSPINKYDSFGLFCEDQCGPIGSKKIIGAKYQILATSMGTNPSELNDISGLIDNLYVLQAIINAAISLGTGATPEAILHLVSSQLPSYPTAVLKSYVYMMNWAQGNFSGARVFTVILYRECEEKTCCFGRKKKLDFGKTKQSELRNCVGDDTATIVGDMPHFGSTRSALENVSRCVSEHKKLFE